MRATSKLIGYAPDADPTTEGIMTNCAAILPSLKGFISAPSPVNYTLPALAAACQGMALIKKLDNTTRLIAGTGVALYEDATTAWTTVTRAAGGAYGPAPDVRWSFTQFNNTTLAIQKADQLQFSVSGVFANVAGAPKASVVETVNEFVFLFDTNEAIYGDSPNRWWCAAQGNYTDWTPSNSTNCYTGTLFSSPGKIKAAKRFGDNIIVYKDRAMYSGYFAGSPTGWIFKEIVGDTGALSQNVVVNVGTAESPKHIFMGYYDFYQFDGGRPIPLGANILKNTVFDVINRQYSHVSQALHDFDSNRIFFFYPTSGSVNPDKCVVYNYKTNTWGRDDRSIEAVVEYITAATTYDGVGALFATYDNLPNLAYDSAFSAASTPVDAIVNTNHVLQTLTGIAGASSITTGDHGDDNSFSMVQRIKPRFLSNPTSASLTNYYRNNLGDPLVLDQYVGLINNRFDYLREARWHREQLNFIGNMEIVSLVADFEVGGDE